MLGLIHKTDSESNSLIGIGRKETIECECLNTVQLKPFVISFKYHCDCVDDYYGTQMKLRQSNVFTGVCLYTGGEGSHVTNIHDAFDLTVLISPPPDMDLGAYPKALLDMGPVYLPPPPPRPGYWHLVVHHWRPVQTCSLADLSPSPTPPHLMVGTKTRMVGKQTVRILLECFLVTFTVEYSGIAIDHLKWCTVPIFLTIPVVYFIK